MELNGRAALITGGAKRVGRAITESLAHAGCRVAIHFHRSQAEAQQLAARINESGGSAVTIRGDLAEPVAWENVVHQTTERLAGLDILINNASEFLSATPDTIEAFEWQHWERMFRINLTAVAGLCHFAQPYLAAGGVGKIINLCDTSADRPHPRHLAYCASKAGLMALTRGLARALAPAIQVNGISPGIAIFPESYTADQQAHLISKVPLQRAGTPEDVASAVRYLLESGDYVTGEILRVDGGRSLI